VSLPASSRYIELDFPHCTVTFFPISPSPIFICLLYSMAVRTASIDKNAEITSLSTCLFFFTDLLVCQLCDVTLTSGKRRIPAHRLVLSAASDRLADMLSLCDVSSVDMPTEINISDVDVSALDDVINYIYTGEFESPLQVSKENTICCELAVC